MKNYRIKQQSGFTLVELLVALVILTILAVTVTGAFDGSKSRAQALVSNMKEFGNANIRLKNDTGCYVNRPDALYNMAVGQAATSNYCNKDFTSTWNGPYVSKFTADAATGNANIDKIASGAQVAFLQEAGGMGTRYVTRATGLPNDIVKNALQECNADVTESTAATYFDNHQCRGTASGADGSAVFEMVYDETR